MLKEFIQDLMLPGNYYRHQQARQKAFVLLGLAVAGLTGYGMMIGGYGLGYILLGSFLSFLTTTIPTLALFTQLPAKLAKAIDDRIHPIVPVEIKFAPDAAKTARREQLITEVLNASVNEVNDQNIQQIKAKLKEIFALRAYCSTPKEELDKSQKSFREDYRSIVSKIKTEEDWEKPEIHKQINLLMLRSVIFSDQVLAQAEKELRDRNKPISTATVSQLLVNQGKRYPFDFMYLGIIDLYHFTYGKFFIKDNGFLGYPKACPDKAHEAKFYNKGTSENIARKMYNTFVKHGFYQRYGNKAFKEQLLKDDTRFESWTKKDSKKTKKFSGLPDTRPT